MGKKGIYSGTIALIAVVIISGIVFAMVSNAQLEEGKSSINEMIYLKWESQNAYYLLWQAAADAVADSVYYGDGTTTCSFDAAIDSGTMQARIADYLGDALNGAVENCTVSGITSIKNPGAPNEVLIDFTISCAKNVQGMEMAYEKQREINKRAYIQLGGGGSICFVDIFDVYSEVCQVDKIPAGPGGGCSR